jgi:hypothetical protein
MSNGFELISDLYKEAFGSRPSGDYLRSFDEQSDSDKESEWNSLLSMMEFRESSERESEARALETYTARIAGMMNDYGISQATAIRWDMDAFDIQLTVEADDYGTCDQDIEHYLWRQGLAFSAMPQFVAIIKQEFGL